ncbi:MULTISPECIES: winged helix-turn-helix domain-containing protein [unclassified Sphingomonas]|jgi:two-component system, OmpR family, response regulator|uniref:winged helix-turn-helix domain-containing protein n=1 Tax=unclassified Sphingomonas TaxID=196159 RepID=UPI000A771F1B|nr:MULTISPECIES: winged helix-turn-helix domain-containing protein [unclassified Sphingomonas]
MRRVRARSALAVVMLTARSDEVERVIGLELGADDYLAKPCFPCELLMHGGDTVSTKDALCLGVLGRSRHACDRSIDVHMSNLRLKLDRATGRNIGIETVRGVGYRLRLDG